MTTETASEATGKATSFNTYKEPPKATPPVGSMWKEEENGAIWRVKEACTSIGQTIHLVTGAGKTERNKRVTLSGLWEHHEATSLFKLLEEMEKGEKS